MDFKTKREALFFVCGYKTAYDELISAFSKALASHDNVCDIIHQKVASSVLDALNTLRNAIPDEFPDFHTVEAMKRYIYDCMGWEDSPDEA